MAAITVPVSTAGLRTPAPPCSEHPGGRTWHDGYYGKKGVRGYFQHPRFRCRPDPHQPETHVFTNHRRVAAPGDPYCEYCERHRTLDEGPRTPADFEFGIVEIATSLYDLASGSSYRGTSKLRRRELDRPARARPKDTRSGDDRFSNQGHLVRDWLEEFGPVVLAGKEYTEWPRILVLDDKGYRPKLCSPRTDGYFRIYAGFDGLGHQLARVAFYFTRRQWPEFLDLLPGEPEVVVADGADEIYSAVKAKWPCVRFWRSHWHLQHRQLHNDAQSRDSLIPTGHWLVDVIEDAFASSDAWWTFVEACRTELAHAGRLQRWLDANADAIADQVEDDFTPKSTGGVEERLRRIGDRIGERRAFANKERTDLLLRLWTLHLNHRAHRDEFIRKIRRHLEANGHRPQKSSRRGGRAAVTGQGHRNCRCHPKPISLS